MDLRLRIRHQRLKVAFGLIEVANSFSVFAQPISISYPELPRPSIGPKP